MDLSQMFGFSTSRWLHRLLSKHACIGSRRQVSPLQLPSADPGRLVGCMWGVLLTGGFAKNRGRQRISPNRSEAIVRERTAYYPRLDHAITRGWIT